MSIHNRIIEAAKSQRKTSESEAAALELLERGFRPIAIYPPGVTIGKRTMKGKEPIGEAWGSVQWTAKRLRDAYRKYPTAGVGIVLGPGTGPGGTWLVDFEGDGEAAEDSLATLLGGEDVQTLAWSSRRGRHRVFTVDGERLLELLSAAGAKEKTGAGKGTYHLDALPGLEIRIGGPNPDGTLKQFQSVVPPTAGENGKAREWTGTEAAAELPEAAYAALEEIAERLAIAEVDQADQSEPCEVTPQADGERKAQAAASPRTPKERATAYLGKIDPGKQGEGGSNPMLWAATVLRIGFDLDRETTYQMLRYDYGSRCDPPWTDEAEIRHKIDDAEKFNGKPKGWLLDDRGRTPPPSRNGSGDDDEHAAHEADDDPHRLARVYLAKRFTRKGKRTLVYHQGEFHCWENSAYRPVVEHELNPDINQAVKREFNRLNRLETARWEEAGKLDKNGKSCPPPQARKVSTRLIGDVKQALCAMTLLPGRIKAPAWLIDNPPFPATDVLPTLNALVHLPSFVDGKPVAIHPATPDYFCPYALDFHFDPNAPAPAAWDTFLKSAWPEDKQSVSSLDEFSGYLLTPDTSQQTIAMMIGPTRSGRGTIARIMRALIGPDNVASPTFSGIASHFGAAGLIGKPLAIIGDARLSRRSDWVVALERFLSISGEDAIDIPRKNKPDWSGRLPTRFMLISNELPEIPDQANALAARLLVFRFTESFFGREDRTLDARLKAELPGICLRAIKGWKRLRERGRFIQPESSQDMLDQFKDLSSSLRAYVRERLNVSPQCSVLAKTVFQDWTDWCVSTNRNPGTDGVFGRNLRTVCPTVKRTRPRDGKDRSWTYEGIELNGTHDF